MPAPLHFRVAAASDLMGVLDAAQTALRLTHPQVVMEVTLASSGILLTQVQHGAPFDVFMSANAQHARLLLEQGLAVPGSFFEMGQGRLVAWTAAPGLVDLRLPLRTIFLDDQVTHISVANVVHAPYGMAAAAFLKGLGVHDAVAHKLVQGESVAQAAAFAANGSAQVGLVALSLVRSGVLPESGRFVEVPVDAYPPLLQAGVIFSSTKNRGAAYALRSWILSDAGQKVLQRLGYLQR